MRHLTDICSESPELCNTLSQFPGMAQQDCNIERIGCLIMFFTIKKGYRTMNSLFDGGKIDQNEKPYLC